LLGPQNVGQQNAEEIGKEGGRGKKRWNSKRGGGGGETAQLGETIQRNVQDGRSKKEVYKGEKGCQKKDQWPIRESP